MAFFRGSSIVFIRIAASEEMRRLTRDETCKCAATEVVTCACVRA